MSSAFMQNKKLGRGINIGNALEAPKEGDWGLSIKKDYFVKIKAKGFFSVRIPIRWSAHSKNVFPFLIDEPFFKRIDTIINAALISDLVVVINIHHFVDIFHAPNRNREKFVLLWKQISERYKDYSENLFFELLNEPHYKLTAKKWNSLLRDAVSIIRNTNPTRTILIGPAKWNKLNGLKKLQLPPNDNNLILTFHYYSPFIFTHQGAHWIKFSNLFLGKKWSGTKRQRIKIEKDFNFAKEWSIKFNVPVNLGEFGAYHKADYSSRVLWTHNIARNAEKKGFSWFYWEFGAGFGVYNTASNEWDEELLNSLIPNNKLLAINSIKNC